MEGECPANMAKNTDWAYNNLNHGVLPGIGDFLKHHVQTMFSAQKK